MKAASTDAIGMLRWGLRRYRWLFLLCLLLGAVLAPLAALQRGGVADAQALVVADRPATDLEAIPRYGETIFNSGAVELAVANALGGGEDEDDIIPDRVSLVVEQDSIIFGVVGHDRDPQVAADIANVAADAFVRAMNEGGAAGTFSLQSEAQRPADPDRNLGTVYAIPVGIGAGLVLGLAVVATLLVVRRPVVEGTDAEELTGVAALGTVTVPRTPRGRFAPPETFNGIVPVCRRLLGLPTPTVVLVSRPQDERTRLNIGAALVGMLRHAGEIAFVGPPEVGGTAPSREHVKPEQRTVPARTSDGAPRLTVMDGGNLFNLVQPPRSTATVLVVPEGITSVKLRNAVVEHLGGSAEARLLLVRKGKRVRGEDLSEAATQEVPATAPEASAAQQ